MYCTTSHGFHLVGPNSPISSHCLLTFRHRRIKVLACSFVGYNWIFVYFSLWRLLIHLDETDLVVCGGLADATSFWLLEENAYFCSRLDFATDLSFFVTITKSTVTLATRHLIADGHGRRARRYACKLRLRTQLWRFRYAIVRRYVKYAHV